MPNLTHRQRIDAALAAASAAGIVFDHIKDQTSKHYYQFAADAIAFALSEEDVHSDEINVHLHMLRHAVPLVGGMDINVAEKIQTIERIVGLPLTPLPATPTPKVPA